ncbi:MAG TPA: ABC transporter ATP-binding protein [Actinocrinis sp.]|nr:ABC transporter ATP-binding protein [Actinocrinis sp.]
MAVITVDGLRKQYGDYAAVRDVSFSVERGEIFGIVGPNGAGKTTSVECVVGLRRRDGGTVDVLGLDPERDRAEVRRRVGIQLQESALPDRLRVWEALELFSSFYRDPADWRLLLEQLHLADKRDTAFKKLSGGQKQRLSIALALVGRPQIAVLDELTTGLDPAARRDTWRLVEQVRDTGVTILLVTHFMEEAERLCDRVAVIDAGRVVAVDSPAGLVSRADPRRRVTFRVPGPFDHRLLSALPEVAEVRRNGNQVVVDGTGELLQAVASVLARNQIIPLELRIDQANLEDAFVSLTRRDGSASGPHDDAAAASAEGR